MFEIKVDTHVHSINSVHAYSTINEITEVAQKKDLEAVVITDHFGPHFLSSSLFQMYAGITNIRNMPSTINKIEVLNGAEVDIIDKYGNLAFFDSYFPFEEHLSVLELLYKKTAFFIASFHNLDGFKLTGLETTKMLVSVLGNPYVDVLGHCDRINTKFDEIEVIKEAKWRNKVIEFNCHSFNQKDFSREKLRKLALLCAQEGVKISVGSDAHFATQVGDFGKMINFFQEIDFPEKLIINKTKEDFKKHILQKSNGYN